MQPKRTVFNLLVLLSAIFLIQLSSQIHTSYALGQREVALNENFLEFQEYQTIPTVGAWDWEHFTIGDDVFLAVANRYDGSTFNHDSKIYKWDGNNFVEFQVIPTHGGADWQYFSLDGDTYLAITNGRNDSSTDIDSIIYKWDGTSFVEFQAIPTHHAQSWEYFTIGSDAYLAVSNQLSSISTIYKWNGTQFIAYQNLPTSNGNGWQYFSIDGESYLAVANTAYPFNNISRIYKWNGSSFIEFQSIPTSGAIEWEFFNIDNASYLAVVNATNGSTVNIESKIYKWDGTSFVEFQSIATQGANDWEFFTLDGHAYLTIANVYDGSTAQVDSVIYQWNGSQFVEFQSIATHGARSWKYFTINNDAYLAVANGSSNSSVIYKAESITQDHNNLVAYYPFNNSANDESGNGFHGTLYDVTPTTDRFGNINSAYKFNGSSTAITVPGNDLKLEFPEGSDITLSAWIKLDSYNSDHTIIVAMESGINVQTRSSLRIDSNGYPYYFALAIPRELYGTNPVPLNEWHHIAATHEGTDAKLYLDGELIAHNPDFGALTEPYLQCSGGSGSLPFQNKCVSLAIGAWTDWWGVSESIFNGTIDEVRLYNSALSGSEISELYCNSCSSQDLAIQSTGISFFPPVPSPAESVTINANISNLGLTNVNDILVSFYDFNTLLDQTNITSLASGTTTDVSIETVFPNDGFHLITVKVDPNNSILETNENNNITSQILQVGQPDDSEAAMIVQANDASACQGGVTVIDGHADYDFANVPGVPDHPVQGGLVTVTILDPATSGVLNVFTGAKSSISGNFNQPILAPALNATYPISVSVTDGTITTQTQTSLTVSGQCATPPPGSGDGGEGPTNGGNGTQPGITADVYIYSENILFSDENPDPGETTIVFAYIHYVGTEPVLNMPVSLNDIYPAGGVLRSFPIDSVLVSFPNGQDSSPVAISIPWTNTAAGAHIIQAITEPPISQFAGNDKATRLIYVGEQPLLEISKNVALLEDADGDGVVSPGDTIVYTLSYENQGSSDVTGAIITDDYDETLLGAPLLISDDGMAANGIITWNLGTLVAGTSGSVTYEVAVIPESEFPSGTTSIVNYALLSTDQTPTVGTTHEVEIVLNQSPEVSANGPFTMEEGGSVQLTASGSDPDGDSLTYAWDLDNDGTFETLGQSVIFTSDDGPASDTIAVKVTDAGGLTATDQTTVEVQNIAPTAVFSNASGDIDEGGTATLSFSNQADPSESDSAAGFLYFYDCTDDGTFELSDGSATSFTCNYPDNGVFTARGRIQDKDGEHNEYTVDMVIMNVAPTVNAGADQTVYRNDPVFVSGTWTDPATNQDNPYTWTWNLTGEGSFNSIGSADYGTTITEVTTFSHEGFYTLTFQVMDKEGDTGVDSLIVEVLNRAPDCSLAVPSQELLWPPNHQFVPIRVLGITDPEGDSITITIDSIFHNELRHGKGNGNFEPDWQGIGTSIAKIRAERDGRGNGRTYHIGFTAVDGHGGSCSGEILVTVPKSRTRRERCLSIPPFIIRPDHRGNHLQQTIKHKNRFIVSQSLSEGNNVIHKWR